MEFEEINIVPEKFAAWLDTLPDDLVMADEMRCKTCPLANYFYYLGYQYACVGPWDCSLGMDLQDSEQYALPDWAVTFIDMFDDDSSDTVGKAKAIMMELV